MTHEIVLCLLKSKEGSDSEYEQDQERLEEIEGFLSQHDLEFNRLVCKKIFFACLFNQ